jgi:hypothetical protein
MASKAIAVAKSAERARCGRSGSVVDAGKSLALEVSQAVSHGVKLFG